MTDAFQHIRDALGSWAISSLRPEDFPESPQRRLVHALHGLADNRVGLADVASLIANLLARESAQTGVRQSLSVPLRPELLERETWERCGLAVVELETHRLLRPTRWTPHWLSRDEDYSPGEAALKEVTRRNYVEIEGDPCLRGAGRSRYRCVGQREAIRAVLGMPPGATLVVNLPTGAGKSLCAQLPALAPAEGLGAGLTVVVVPTTALAIDQETAVRPWYGHHTAFYSTESLADGRRTGILQRIFSDSQGIVFTSPEALLSGLAPAVYGAAKRGTLRYMVVDEAHVIEHWGDEFRSSFQELSGLRSDLVRHSAEGAAFRTVLLTGTLTEECLATLRGLFAPTSDRGEADFGVTAAVQLRPEPEYWIARASTPAQREQWVTEAVHRLPRSIILYVTRPHHAELWKQRLRQLGYMRCESITGKTHTRERERIIQQWRTHQTDIVVATSAFGLGMDQEDVRSVIHACVPENIDRYYQEVGRGGRDGKASLSLTVYTPEDVNAARRLNRSTIIGIERGRERWTRMFGDSRVVALGRGRFRIPIDVVPSFRPGDIDMENDYNVAWNVRTLTLMSRAGLIALDSEDPTREVTGTRDEPVSSAAQVGTQSRVVRILNANHRDKVAWQEQVDPIRIRSSARDRRAFAMMTDALEIGDQCIADYFAAAYEIDSVPLSKGTPLSSIRVSRSCGGCPWCRAHGVQPYAGAMPVPFPPWPPQLRLGNALNRFLGAGSIAVFSPSHGSQRLERLVDWLIAQGCRTVVCRQEDRSAWFGRLSTRPSTSSAFLVTIGEYAKHSAPRFPTLLLLNDLHHINGDLLEDARRNVELGVGIAENSHTEVPRVYLLHQAATGFDRTDRFLRDTLSLRRYDLDEFEELVGL